jgi:hypothetical protein
MKTKYLFVITVLLLSAYVKSQHISGVFQSHGNVYLQFGKSSFSSITKGKMDTLPKLSNNKKYVLFLRVLPKNHTSQIIRYDIATSTESVMVQANTDYPEVCTPISYANSDDYPFPCLGSISNIELSPDDKRIYFETDAWAVSAAIHYYSFTTKKIQFFHSGSINRIFSNGMVDVQTTGNDGNGRYWQSYLFDINGKKIRPALGKKTY